MDHIALYVDGRHAAGKGSGFATIMISTNNRWQRSFAYGMHTVNAADMLAVKFGLLSVAEAFKTTPIKVYTKNKYVQKILELKDGYFTQVANANAEIVEDVRRLVRERQVEVLIAEGPEAELCQKLAEQAIVDGKTVDDRR